MYERSVLILDSPLCELGETSLGLISLGLRPLYATDFEELLLLARERRQHVGALLAPASLLVELLEPIRKRLLSPLGLPIECVVPAVKEPRGPHVEQLALAGVRFAAFDPISPRDLRFLVALALSVADAHEARRAPRLPCDVAVVVRTDVSALQGRIVEMSTGGAYVAMRAPLRPNTAVTLELALPDGALELPARVVWRTAIDGGGAAWLESGMGVEFAAPSDAVRTRLAELTRQQLARYAVAGPAGPSEPAA